MAKKSSSWGQKPEKAGAGAKATGQFELPEDCSDVMAFMGWDGVVVADERACVVDMARRYFGAVQDGSCAKCVPCRVGTRVVLEIFNKFDEGHATAADLKKLREAVKELSGISLCGLGITAIRPLADALDNFGEEFDARMNGAADCEVPGGYAETLTAPCQNGCPAGVRIPDFVGLLADGKVDEAVEVFKSTNPFPAVIGRVCPHPCQDVCTRNSIEQAVCIMYLHRFIGDHAIEMRARGIVGSEPVTPDGEKVAVVGAGPAGLTCGYYLAKFGHKVTIFEALPAVGGMLRAGIPEYRLPNGIIDKEVDFIRDLGVEIQCNVHIGKDIPLQKLRQDYKAVFVGVGAHVGKKMGVEGEDDYEGMVDAVAYLRRVGLGDHTKPGDRVCVIGGGNTAVDAARTSLRLGCSEVSIVYRRSRDEMPANIWEIEEAEEEKVNFYLLANPTKILGSDGKVTGMECIRMELGEPDESGRRRPVPVEGSEFIIECDVVIPAVSQAPDLSLLEGSGVETTRRSTIVTDPWTMTTDVDGIFAGGDAVLGPMTVVAAVGQGRRAAISMNQYLRGEKVEDEAGSMMKVLVDAAFSADGHVDVSGYTEQPAKTMEMLRPEERVKDFSQIEQGYDYPTALSEADRCIRCYRLLTAARRSVK